MVWKHKEQNRLCWEYYRSFFIADRHFSLDRCYLFINVKTVFRISKMRTFIQIGGVLWVICFIFHVLFWRLFDWKNDLESVNKVNKGIIQVLNLCLMLCFLIFAYISLVQTDELLSSSLGKSLIAGMALFGGFRVAEQFIFFDLRLFRSKVVLFGALLIGIVYTIPLFI